jgi:hypothetical protein
VVGLARSYQLLASNINRIERLSLSPLFTPFIGTVFAVNTSDTKGLQKHLTSLRKIDKGCGVLRSVGKHSFFFDNVEVEHNLPAIDRCRAVY